MLFRSPSNSALYVQGPVLGAQTGASIASGYVGEVILKNPAANVTPAASLQDCNKTVTSQLLQPGVYLVSGVVSVNRGSITGFNNVYACISLNDNANDSASKNNVGFAFPGTTIASPYVATPIRYLNITTPTTVYLTAGIEYTALGSAVYQTASSLQIIRLN